MKSSVPESSEVQVAEALARIRSAVRQSQAALATRDERFDGPAALVRLQQCQHVQDAAVVSSGSLFGPLVVWIKKVLYHLFVKTQLRSALRQQNEFNQATTLAIQELLEEQRRLAREQARLAKRVAGDPPSREPKGS